MPKARRSAGKSFTFRLESLESRTLMSVGGQVSLVSAPWALGETVNAATAVLVKFDPTTSSSQVWADLATVGGRVVTQYPNGPALVALAPWTDRDAALTQLRASRDVAYAEADATLHADAAVIPNNPQYGQEWGMAFIDAPYAWGVSTGSASVIVAVLDSGIDTRNAAFSGRIWTNPDPTSGKLGYKGDLHGWNFVSNNSNIQDNNGHGTHVSGILGATGNNGVGIAGVNWKAQIMPLKVLDAQGNGSTDAAVNAVYYAVQHGAKVINASWGGDVFSQSMLDALNYADRAGVVFVTAAGNDSSNNDQSTTYPASFRASNELVVAAIDATGNLADYSNYGATTVDIAAPGTDILSTVLNNQYQRYTGTSMATPFVTGTVALLAGQNPGLTAEQLVAQIRATAKPVASLAGKMISPGVVDPYFALLNYTGPSKKGGGSTSLSSLVPNGTSYSDVETAILTSNAVFTALGSNNSAYIPYVFHALVGRDASGDDINYFVNAFAGGLSRLNFVRSIQNSVEARLTRVARLFQNEFEWTQTLDTLKSDSNVIYFANLLSSGWSQTDVLANVLSSASYRQNVGGTDAAYISSLYNVILARPVDSPSMTAFQNAINAGVPRDALVRYMLASVEGRQTAIARLFRDELNSTESVNSLKGNAGITYWSSYLVSA